MYLPIYRQILCLLGCLWLGANIASAQSDAAQIRKGNEAYRQGNYDIARQYYERAANGQLAAQAFYNSGNAHYEQQQYAEAAQAHARAAQNLPNAPQRANAYYNQGNALLKAGKVQESIDAYKNALRQNPNDADAKYNLAYAQKLKQQQQQQGQNQEGQGVPNSDNNAAMPNGTLRRMTKQEAARLLEAMRLEELKVQQRVRKSQAQGKAQNRGGKDW